MAPAQPARRQPEPQDRRNEAGRGDGDGHPRRVPHLVKVRPEPSPGLPRGAKPAAPWLGTLGPPEVLLRWLATSARARGPLGE